MKKKRSILLRLFVWWFKGVALMALVVLIFGWPAVRTQPGLTRDWVAEMNSLKDSMEPEGEAAWPIYRDIIVNDFGIASVEDQECSPLRTQLNELALIKKHPGMRDAGWQEAIFDPHRELLDRSGTIFDKLDLAVVRPRMGKEYVRDGSPLEGEQNPSAPVTGLHIYMPELGELRALSRLNGLRTRRASERGDWEEFQRSVESGVLLGQHCGNAGTLIEELVGVSIAVIPLKLLQSELTHKTVPADVCVRIDELLQNTLDMRGWCRNTLELEWISTISSLEEIYGTNGYSGVGLWEYDGDARAFVDHSSWWRRLFNAYAIFVATKQNCIDSFSQVFDKAKEGLRVEPGELRLFQASMNSAYDSLAPVPAMVDILMPALDRAIQNNIMFERDILATRIMLRLEAIHAGLGEWPVSLDAIPELAELNKCPLTGDPFEYIRLTDDEHGRAYTLLAPETPWENMNDYLDYTEPRDTFVPQSDEDELPMF